MPDETPEPIQGEAAHICVDMQNIFSGDSPWAVPWMDRITDKVVEIAQSHEEDTIFTRFIPARRPGKGMGLKWKEYYEAWADMTLERLKPGMIDLVPALQPFAAKATLVDKHVYSPWVDSNLSGILRHRDVETLIITGGETEVCVLGTVMGAVDRGYRTIIVDDAVCSSADETHDAMMTVYRERLSKQIEVMNTEQLLSLWR